MPTIKDVVYKNYKEKKIRLWLLTITNLNLRKTLISKGIVFTKFFDREVDFWINELTILPIDSKTLENAVYDLHVKTGLGLFFDVFENTVLPLLLKHWKFEEG